MSTNRRVKKQWLEAQSTIGFRLVADVKKTIQQNLIDQSDNTYDKGARLFFGWLAKNSCDERRLAARSLFQRGCRASAPEAEVQLVSVVFEQWYRELQSYANIGPTTAFNYARGAAFVLQWLGQLSGVSYPKYQRRYHKVPKPVVESPTLSSVSWSELEGVTGLARERAALNLVFNAAAAEFWHFAAMFEFCQSVLEAKSSPEDAHSDWFLVSECLIMARKNFLHRDLKYCCAKDISLDLPVSAALSITWLNAGLDIDCVNAVWGEEHQLSAAALARFTMCCLAPSLGSVTSAAAAFAAETGWNKTAILALASNPIIFGIQGSSGVATRDFLAAFKRRAGHVVLACLDEDRPICGMLEDRFRKEWGDAVAEFPVGRGYESNIILDGHEHGRLIKILRQCQRMATVARDLDPRCEAAGTLLAFPTWRESDQKDGLATPNILNLKKCRSAILCRSGVNFPSIRQSYLVAHWNENRSLNATMVVAGHSGPSVLMRHYLNKKEVNAELMKAIRFFQTTVQTLILTARRNPVVHLRLDEEHLRWFEQLAFSSGMAAAFGLPARNHHAASIPVPVTLQFNPTKVKLQELYITHWALRRAKSTLSPGIWQARWLPLFAAAKAIRVEICGNGGLKNAYFAAIREAYRNVAAGRVALPPVEGA